MPYSGLTYVLQFKDEFYTGQPLKEVFNQMLDLALRNQLCKEFEAPVIGLFRVCWKAAGGQLPHIEMVLDAFTADALSGT